MAPLATESSASSSSSSFSCKVSIRIARLRIAAAAAAAAAADDDDDDAACPGAGADTDPNAAVVDADDDPGRGLPSASDRLDGVTGTYLIIMAESIVMSLSAFEAGLGDRMYPVVIGPISEKRFGWAATTPFVPNFVIRRWLELENSVLGVCDIVVRRGSNLEPGRVGVLAAVNERTKPRAE